MCAIEEDQRVAERQWQGLEFLAKLMVGAGEEPTEEKPIVSQTVRSESRETTVKKVVDFKHEDRVKVLAEQSSQIMAEAGPILERMRQEMLKGKVESSDG